MAAGGGVVGCEKAGFDNKASKALRADRLDSMRRVTAVVGAMGTSDAVASGALATGWAIALGSNGALALTLALALALALALLPLAAGDAVAAATEG